MISDVSSTNDFFLKPEARSKRAQDSGLSEGTSVESTKKAENNSGAVKNSEKVAPKTKSEFARKLKSYDEQGNEKASSQSSKKDSLASESSQLKSEAPIRKRVSQEDEGTEVESLADPDADRFSFKSTPSRPLSSAKQKMPMANKDEEIIESNSNDDSSSREMKTEPNMQLFAVLTSPQFDVKDLSPSELKEVKEALRDQQAEVKQASVQKFMGQLQAQYGITPDKVVQAFAKMDEKTLTAPPSETISQFVNNLNVKGPARQQIANLYKQMLNETGEAALNEKLLGSDDESKSVSLKVMDSTQAKLEQLNKSLDKLNDSFFRKGEFQPQANQQIPPSIKEQLKKLTQSGQSEDQDSKSSNNLGAMLAKLSGQAGGMAAAVGAEDSAAAPSVAPMAGATSAQVPVMDMSAFAQSQSQNSDQGEAAEDNQRGTKNYAAQNTQQNSNLASKNFADSTKLNLKSDTIQTKSASSAASATQSTSAGNIAGATASVAGSTAAALSPQQMMMTGPSKQESAENVQEVIKQAQVIIKKGGGEMNVEMKPEGMGQVHLKIALENGQVNIQMMAQNDKVKKLLEDGIHELKGNLAAHKLQVESLKIGIASGLADKKMEQQQGETQREAMREAQREMAGNFAGEMRDQRNDRNSGFADVPGWRAYRSEPKQRVSVEATPDEQNFKRRDESRRLSVFA